MHFQQLGKQLKERRNVLDLTQKELADIADVSLRTIVEIEKGYGNPTFETINRIIEVLGMEISLKVKQ